MERYAKRNGGCPNDVRNPVPLHEPRPVMMAGGLTGTTTQSVIGPQPQYGPRSFVDESSRCLGHDLVGFLGRGDPHDLHGVADHVGGALLASRSLGHSRELYTLQTRERPLNPVNRNVCR